MKVLLGLALPLMAGLVVFSSVAAADDTIYDIQQELYPPGTIVNIEGVVVTGVGRFGFFVQEPEEDATWGRQYSGLWVYTNDIPSTKQGDLVNVTGGYEEYRNICEINLLDYDGSYSVVGSVAVPDPVEVTIPEINATGIYAEAYEAVLVRVDREDAELIAYPAVPADAYNWVLRRGGAGTDSMYVTAFSALPGGDFEYDFPDSGTVLTFAQGIQTQRDDRYSLAPRNCDVDLGMACKPRLRGAYATSSTGVGVQFGVPISEESGTNIANYELQSGANVLGAVMDPENDRRVYLTTDDLGNGEEEELTVHGIISTEGAPMDGSESAFFRTGITPIRTIQYVSTPSNTDVSPLISEVVTVSGRVTALDGSNYYFLQDDDGGPWDGLYCRIAMTEPLEIGDRLTVAGEVDEYYGWTQLSFRSGVSHWVKHGYQEAVNTNVVTCSDIPYRNDPDASEQYEDCLVRLESAELDSLLGVVGPYYSEWHLFQDGDPDTAYMDFYELGPHGYDACVGDVVNVTGILAYEYVYSIWPRYGRGIDIEVIYDNPACEPTGVEEAGLAAGPPRLSSRPNPFNPRTTIRFRLSTADQVRLEICDPSGRLVRTLIDNAALKPGEQQVIWDGRDDRGHDVGTGTYFAKLHTTKGFTANKMILLK